MAYGVIYRHNFIQMQTNVQFKLDILKNGYGGAVTDIKCGASPCLLNKGNDGDFLFEPIKSSELLVNVVAENNFDFRDMITSEEDEFICNLYRYNGSTYDMIWRGFYVTDIYNEIYEDAPYSIQLRFIDGLGRLKNIAYNNNDIISTEDITDLRTNRINILAVLVFVFNKLGWSYPIYDSVNIYEDSFLETTADSPLTQTFIYESRYYDTKLENGKAIYYPWNCYRVLEAVLTIFGARLWIDYHTGDVSPSWNIACIRELYGTSLVRRKYTDIGNFISVSTVNYQLEPGEPSDANWEDEALFVNRDHTLEFLPVYRKITVSYNPGDLIYNNGVLIPDWSFENWSSATALNQWSGSAEDSGYLLRYWGDFNLHEGNQYRAGIKNNESLPPRVSDSGDDEFKVTIANQVTSKYIESQAVNISQSGNDLELTFNLQAIVHPSDTGHPFFAWVESPHFKFSVICGTKYLDWNGQDAGEDDYTWTTTNTYNKVKLWTDYSIDGYTKWISWTSPTTFTIRVTLPENGNLKVRIYEPDFMVGKIATNIILGQVFTSKFDGAIRSTILVDAIESKIIINDDGGQEQVLYNTELNNNSTIDPIEIEVVHDDMDNVLNTGVMTLSSGAVTDSWHTRGNSEDVQLMVLLSQMVAKNFEDNKAVLRGSFKHGGVLDFKSLLKITEGATVYQYVCNGYSWDISHNEVVGEWIQNLDFTYDLSLLTFLNNKAIGFRQVTSGSINLGNETFNPVGALLAGGGLLSLAAGGSNAGVLSSNYNIDVTDAQNISLMASANMELSVNTDSMKANDLQVVIQQNDNGGYALNLGAGFVIPEGSGSLAIESTAWHKTVLTFKKNFNGLYRLYDTETNILGENIYIYDETISSDDFKAIDYSPYELVAAPGTGYAILPLSPSIFFYDYGGTAYVVPSNLTIQINNATSSLLTASSTLFVGTVDVWGVFNRTSTAANTVVVENEPLVIKSGLPPTTGNGTIRIIGLYTIQPV